jgi:non-ribosomal peptide synthetase component F
MGNNPDISVAISDLDDSGLGSITHPLLRSSPQAAFRGSPTLNPATYTIIFEVDMAGEKLITPVKNAAGSFLALPVQQGLNDAAVGRMLDYFQSVLKGMAADLSPRESELPPSADAEKDQLPAESNATEAHLPPKKCVQELFETQVERTPNAVALVYSKGEVSYRELDYQANRVAIHLRSLGVGPNVPVGICVERSTDVVGLQGILKAGGAYLLLDPAYPKERLVAALVDSGMTVLSTQGPVAGRFQFQIPNCREVCLESLRRTPGNSGAEMAKHN